LDGVLGITPFVCLLLSIAILPLTLPHWWEKNRNKLLVSAIWAIPAAVVLILDMRGEGVGILVHSVKEYVAFIALLFSLFVITGGIFVKGSLAGTPMSNTVILGIGAVLANFVGTTGASMLLIRPLLRANASRVRKSHIFVFLIFIVSNTGGLLTPLGDPPLFLGFLRGVPFFWTLGLWVKWLVVNGLLLAVFNFVDQYIFDREERLRAGSQLEEVQEAVEPPGIRGGQNFVFLFGVIFVIVFMGTAGPSYIPNRDLRELIQVAGMLLMAGLSLVFTPVAIRRTNRFTWYPIWEVAAIFIGIFVAMTPALHLLEARASELGVSAPWQFFWASGMLSSFLDNAPTYLAFGSLAVGVVNGMHPSAGLHAEHLSGLLGYPEGVAFLTAISCGAVFMGANTYIGNGPNFMVKSIAEENGVAMPGFFGYMRWSACILLPIFLIVTIVFFQS
jgi:Na+/H+ antiporter NhaD/arsenite permease-like protein